MIYITEINEFGMLFDELYNSDKFGMDIETDGLDCFSNKILLIQVKTKNEIFIFDCTKLDNKSVTYLIQLIDSSGKMCIFHNGKFDLKFICAYTGILLKNVYDTMLVEIQLTAGIGDKFYSLADLVKKYKDITLSKDVRESFYKDFNGTITQDQLTYSALDVMYLEDIYSKQMEAVMSTNQDRIIDLEIRTLPVICSMELNGVKLDVEHWSRLADETELKTIELGNALKEEIANKLDFSKYETFYDVVMDFSIIAKTKLTKTLTNQLKEITDKEVMRKAFHDAINLGSSKQVQNILVKIYGIDIDNTNEKTLSKFSYDHPIISKILSFREQEKKNTSFGKAFLEKINPVTGKIHTNYNQLGTATGRFSSDTPNLQNIVRDSEYRECFIPDDGWMFVGFDYSQQELRMIASVTRDPKMMKIFIDNADPHASTAANMFSKKIEEVTKDERHIGKTMNFAVSYGSTEYGLFKNFDIPLENGREYLDNFFNKAYTGFRDFKKAAGDLIWKKSYSVTPMGRRRNFQKKAIWANSGEYNQVHDKVIREGINHIIQGGSADCTKLALCNIFYNNPFGENLKIILQVHDEIVCMAKKEIAEEAFKFIEEQMLSAEASLLKDVPAKCDGYIEDHWKKG